jgi:hypothetical protein
MANNDDIISLKYYLEHLEHERWAAHAKVHEVEQRERKDARNSMQYRLDSMNEFQSRMNDLEKTFVTIPLYESKHHELESGIDNVTARLNLIAGASAVLVVLSGIAGAFIGHILTH